jgi:phosphohistidine swiveling domain-containing protein
MVVFYKKKSEYNNFSKIIGEKMITFGEKNFTKKLIQLTDWLNEFIQKNPNGLGEKEDLFMNKYVEFFAYHQAVFYGAEYIRTKKPSHPLLENLNNTYKYNETAIPNIEAYFAKTRSDKKKSVLFYEKKIEVMNNKTAEKIHSLIEKNYSKYLGNEVKGICANEGIVQGKARVITRLEEQSKCKKGDIVVIPQIRPQYNAILSKVKGIITDEGGILAHAAILCREHNIPCIVGTKNATRIIKNGDEVILNATKGTVTKA